jgi:hypothetical protein
VPTDQPRAPRGPLYASRQGDNWLLLGLKGSLNEYLGFNFHALRGIVPACYTVHVNDPWCTSLNSIPEMFSVSISSNIIEELYHGRICSRWRERCSGNCGRLFFILAKVSPLKFSADWAAPRKTSGGSALQGTCESGFSRRYLTSEGYPELFEYIGFVS